MTLTSRGGRGRGEERRLKNLLSNFVARVRSPVLEDAP